MVRTRTRRQALRVGACAGLGIGFWLGACGPSAHGKHELRTGPIHWWLADRGAQRVIGLDDHLVPVLEVPALHPRIVRADLDGGVWILEGCAPREVLTRVGPDGRMRLSLPFERLLQLCTASCFPGGPGGPGKTVCLEQRGEEWRLVAIDANGVERILSAPDGASDLAVQGDRALVVGAGGRGLTVYDLGTSPAPLARSLPVGLAWRSDSFTRILAIACVAHQVSSKAWGWWSLEGSQARRLVRWSGRLRRRWERSVDFPGEYLLADPVRAGVWVVGGRNVRMRFFDDEGGADGPLELGLSGPVRALAAGRSGPLLALPGALIAFDETGRVRAFQGGFRGISDLSGVPAQS